VGVALQAGQWLDLTLRLGAQEQPQTLRVEV